MKRATGGLIGAVALVLTVLAGLASDVAGEQERSGSVSIGSPNSGKLWKGKQLPRKGRGFLSNQARPNAGATYGTDEMVAALIKAGSDVEDWAPGATLYINDLGFFEGGRIPHHASHQAGRDVDLMFYQFNPEGEVATPVCIRFDADGNATWHNKTPDVSADDEPRVFDTRRNWLVVKSLLQNEEAVVQRIYVAEWVRSRLIDWAVENGEPAWVIERANDVMCQPRSPHDDHFHIRFFCTAEDYQRGCRDSWPLYPWHRTQLAAEGLTNPRLVRPRRRRRRSARPQQPHRDQPREARRLWCP